jgi:hypothetical protein
MQRTLQTCLLSTACALVGLLTVLGAGWAAWDVAAGIQGIILAAFVAASVAVSLRTRGKTVSIFASGFGAGVAAFLAISTAEQLSPGSVEWMMKGGHYGAASGLPLAFLLGTLGLIECAAIQTDSPVKDENHAS